MELKDLIGASHKKIEHSEKQIEKYQMKLQVQKTKRDEINEFDIYELDSFYKKQSDLINRLEIILYKLGDMVSQFKTKYNDGYWLLDICERVYLRKQETLQCMKLANRTFKLCK